MTRGGTATPGEVGGMLSLMTQPASGPALPHGPPRPCQCPHLLHLLDSHSSSCSKSQLQVPSGPRTCSEGPPGLPAPSPRLLQLLGGDCAPPFPRREDGYRAGMSTGPITFSESDLHFPPRWWMGARLRRATVSENDLGNLERLQRVSGAAPQEGWWDRPPAPTQGQISGIREPSRV